jgi:protein-tyrosine-phosphatase
MTHRILFVCTGNVCRSPMAQGLFNARAQREGENHLYIAESAGTWALENQPASAHAITAMAQRGIDITAHRGQTISAELLDRASVVIVMTRNHLDALTAEFPTYRHKMHLMSELKGRIHDINDPYGGTLDEYEECAQQLQDLIESGYSQIKAWASQNDSFPNRTH